jgi:putative transposase
MAYNQFKTGNHKGLPQRKSIRLKGYDYSQAGLYFITICCQNRACLFGEIKNGEMILNDAGKMVEKWYFELENKFPDIQCHEMIIMPNHFHCIIENTGESIVGADLRVCPDILGEHIGEHAGSPLRVCPDILGEQSKNILGESDKNILGEQSKNILGESDKNILGEQSKNILGEHIGSPLHRVVQWFKTMTTNEYIRGVKTLGWTRFDGKLWQRNYWEHIIRNQVAYERISEYIINNPKKWGEDKLKQ